MRESVMKTINDQNVVNNPDVFGGDMHNSCIRNKT